MAKKKHKLTKTQRQKLFSSAKVFASISFGLLLGVVFMSYRQARTENKQPTNLVWAADSTVHVPKTLAAYLRTQNQCKHYRGSDSPTGVGLWSVFQVSHDAFAKIATGCSWSLNSYSMAVKLAEGWTILPVAQYFAPFADGANPARGALPYCSAVEKYRIPKDIESFCIKPDGTAQANEI